MILMKEYVSLTTAVMKMSKKFFTVIIAAPKRKKLFIGWFHVKSSRACHPYLMDFFGVFTSGRYHRDMKIVKMLAPNSKQFRFSGIFKKWQNDDRGGRGKYYIFLDNYCLKQPLALKIPLGMFFDSRNSKMTSKLPKNLLVLSYWQILSKFAMRYISVKKICGIVA